MGRGMSEKTLLRIVSIPMLLLALSTIYPIVFALNASLKTRRDYVLNRFGLTQEFTFDNFSRAWGQAHLGEYFLNSVIVTVGSVACLLVVASLAGFGFAVLRFRGRRVLFYLLLATLMIPVQVILVPFYQTMIALDLINRRPGLIIAYTAFFTPFSVYLMTAFYASVPRSLAEAATIDGASLWQIWRLVYVPLGKPALFTLGILNTLYCWNDLLIALLVLQKDRTLMVGVASLRGEYTTNVPLLAAGVVLAALPVILVYLFFQRRIVSGLTVGAVKG
ncbi:carbohydrate ABC transporter permease [Bauldia litoralis]|uniref:carbohydrate ABC transporter permease n=1 Tax=Bauldia litoralis TaxID=665467 RepID=UPI003266896C